MRANTLEIKKQNKIRILKYISRKGSTSKSEISTELKLSMPTTLQYVKELMESGLIEETGSYESTGGRKAKALSVVGDLGYVAGVDITANHLTVVLVNTRKEIVAAERFRMCYAGDMEYNRAVCEKVFSLAEQKEVPREKLMGVGFSYPGIIDSDQEILLRSHILGISNVSLRNWKPLFQIPCSFENDANCAACAELDDASENAVYLSLSNTVGGAVYMHGQLFPGENHKSAEFGHMVIKKDGKTCYCGKKGCADVYCSAAVLQKAGEGNLEDFFEKLRRKDEKILEVWNDYLEDLAVMIVNLRMAFDCDIVLGGYVGGYLEEFRTELDLKILEQNKFDLDTSYVKIGRYKLLSSAYGATRKHIDSFFETI